MKKCELLVPAGGVNQFIAAVENGADAVYIGGKLFNARINAVNFDDNEIKDAVDFAHKRGVAVHVTMNTLILDEEMEEALGYAVFLYEIGVDALIVQDLGLARLIKENMPDFEIHLSTQGAVYNLEGVKAAAKIGFDRVVLARELSYDEISEICRGTDTEIEVFAHGALCVCYSGQCQLSRHYGGRSGNRGQCAQPCRLAYKTLDDEHRLVKTFKYPLSPKDLCQIDNIGKLADAGVASLKIEGRMKSPEYVAIVTSIYRKYLDLYYANGDYVVSAEDRLALEQIFNRGGFTQGYFNGDPQESLMAGDIPKHRGIKIGKVIKKIQGTSLIDVKLYDTLSIGDGVEIQGKNITGNVVTYYKELKGGLTRIGDIKGHVVHGDPLYRITSKAQLEEARKTFSNKTFAEGKFTRKTQVDILCQMIENGIVNLRFESKISGTVIDVWAGPFDVADGQPTDTQRLREALGKMGNTPFELGDCIFDGLFDRKIQISAINDARRRGLKELEDAMVFRRHAVKIDKLEELGESLLSENERVLEIAFYDWKSFEDYHVPEAIGELGVETRFILPLMEVDHHVDVIDALDDEKRNIVPYISPMSKGKEDDYINENIDIIAEKYKETGIYVGNLGWIRPFVQRGIIVRCDYGLNVFNKYAMKTLYGLGVKPGVKSLESLEEGFGAFPLMVSEHIPEGNVLIDRKKERLDLIKRDYSDQVTIASQDYIADPEVVKQAIAKGAGIVRIFATKSGL